MPRKQAAAIMPRCLPLSNSGKKENRERTEKRIETTETLERTERTEKKKSRKVWKQVSLLLPSSLPQRGGKTTTVPCDEQGREVTRENTNEKVEDKGEARALQEEWFQRSNNILVDFRSWGNHSKKSNSEENERPPLTEKEKEKMLGELKEEWSQLSHEIQVDFEWSKISHEILIDILSWGHTIRAPRGQKELSKDLSICSPQASAPSVLFFDSRPKTPFLLIPPNTASELPNDDNLLPSDPPSLKPWSGHQKSSENCGTETAQSQTQSQTQRQPQRQRISDYDPFRQTFKRKRKETKVDKRAKGKIREEKIEERERREAKLLKDNSVFSCPPSIPLANSFHLLSDLQLQHSKEHSGKHSKNSKSNIESKNEDPAKGVQTKTRVPCFNKKSLNVAIHGAKLLGLTAQERRKGKRNGLQNSKRVKQAKKSQKQGNQGNQGKRAHEGNQDDLCAGRLSLSLSLTAKQRRKKWQNKKRN